jgi:MSHA biogenesis protein MshQ
MLKQYKAFFIFLFSLLASIVSVTKVVAADFFAVTYSVDALHRAPQRVRIVAMRAGRVIKDYTGTIVLTTRKANGSWRNLATRNHGVFDGTPVGRGVASYTFTPADQGVALFDFEHTGPAEDVFDIAVYSVEQPEMQQERYLGSISVSSQGLAFSEEANVIQFDETAVVAGAVKHLYLGAWQCKERCALETNYHGKYRVKFWQHYLNPEIGLLAATVNGKAIGESEAAAQELELNFVHGVAKLDLQYRDVGQLQIAAKMVDNHAGSLGGAWRGSSLPIVFKPAQFLIIVPENPAALNARGAVFAPAGQPLSIDVKVTDIDGNITPNYGNEFMPAGVAMQQVRLLAPVAGKVRYAAGTFTKIAPGHFRNTNFAFHDVGIIQTVAGVDGEDYLGQGNSAGPLSANIGRFVPAYFTVEGSVPKLAAACLDGGFTYAGQSFGFAEAPALKVVAHNLSGEAVSNYTDTFFKLLPEGVHVEYSSSAPLLLDHSSAVRDVHLQRNSDGTVGLSLGSGHGLRYLIAEGKDTAPFQADIALKVTLADQDGVSTRLQYWQAGGVEAGTGLPFTTGNWVYQGRAALMNSFVDVTAPVLPAQVQYYNGSAYVANAKDSCTYLGNPKWWEIRNTDVPVAGQITLQVQHFAGLQRGLGYLHLLAPTLTPPDTRHFWVSLHLGAAAAQLPYLQYPWSGVGQALSDPEGELVLGAYEGRRSVLHMPALSEPK